MNGPNKKLRLKLEHRGYFSQALIFNWPAGVESEEIEASVSIAQPYGYRQELTGAVQRVNDQGELIIDYPLVDEGRYASRASTDAEGRARWGMGAYQFDLTLKAGPKVVGQGVLKLDPNHLFGEINGMRLAQVDSLRQFIECCPERPAFIDKTEIAFTIRTLPDRVQSCAVEVDVVEPKGQERLAGPLHLKLDGQVQKHAFDGEGWARGEHWLRVRIQQDGEPVGPYLVRQIYTETPHRPRQPENPLRIGRVPQYMVDGWIFASSSGLRHAPDQLEHLSEGPIAALDRPWEQGPDHLPSNPSRTTGKPGSSARPTRPVR